MRLGAADTPLPSGWVLEKTKSLQRPVPEIDDPDGSLVKLMSKLSGFDELPSPRYPRTIACKLVMITTKN